MGGVVHEVGKGHQKHRPVQRPWTARAWAKPKGSLRIMATLTRVQDRAKVFAQFCQERLDRVRDRLAGRTLATA